MTGDVLRYFRIEARELLDQLSRGALDLEKGTAAADTVAKLLRSAHTLKGAARVVGQREIAELAHALEDVLAPAREAGAVASRECLASLFELTDAIATHVGALAPVEERESQVEMYRAFRPEVRETDALLGAVAEAHRHLDALRPAVAPLHQDAAQRVERLDRALANVRAAAERLRLVPAGALFTLLERTARDAAQATGRAVVFEGVGGDLRLDAQMLGVVQEALVQLVRNAVAHGIEPVAERQRAGKPADGRVTVRIAREGAFASFECRDDGRGLDVEAIRHALERRGFGSAATKEWGADDLFRRLLEGGISTSGTITAMSGRGVGLDVVREATRRLNGTVAAKCTPGAGTTIGIRAPLALASFEALVTEVAGTTTAIPIDAVVGCRRVAPQDIVRTSTGPCLVVDGETVALASLARALRLPAQGAAGSLGPRARPHGPATVVIVAGSHGRTAFAVDRVIGAATVTMRPLPALAPATPSIAGVAPDANGRLRLVIDPRSLAVEADSGVDQPPPVRPPILVIDDSLTTRMLEQSILESAGYEVEVASSGEEALEKARATRYGLFLVDVEMPGMDGFAFIERVRSDPSLHHVPSILVTSRSAPADRQRGLDAGAAAYIVKGEFDQRALLERIRALVA